MLRLFFNFTVCYNIVILYFIFINNANSSNVPMKDGNYGPYKMESKYIKQCNGPKAVNLTTYTIDNDPQGVVINLTSSKPFTIDQGTYAIEVNYEQSTKMFLGSSFFYGDFYFKIVCLAKQGNLLCLNTRTVLSKPDKEV